MFQILRTARKCAPSPLQTAIFSPKVHYQPLIYSAFSGREAHTKAAHNKPFLRLILKATTTNNTHNAYTTYPPQTTVYQSGRNKVLLNTSRLLPSTAECFTKPMPFYYFIIINSAVSSQKRPEASNTSGSSVWCDATTPYTERCQERFSELTSIWLWCVSHYIYLPFLLATSF